MHNTRYHKSLKSNTPIVSKLAFELFAKLKFYKMQYDPKITAIEATELLCTRLRTNIEPDILKMAKKSPCYFQNPRFSHLQPIELV